MNQCKSHVFLLCGTNIISALILLQLFLKFYYQKFPKILKYIYYLFQTSRRPAQCVENFMWLFGSHISYMRGQYFAFFEKFLWLWFILQC